MLQIKAIKPLFNKIVTTAEYYTQDVKQGSLVIKTAGTLKEFQKVVATGSTVKDIKVGDLVLINPTRYQVTKHQAGSLKDNVITDNPVVKYNFPMIGLNGVLHLLLFDSDVDYIVTDYEEIPDSVILEPEKPTIIV